MQQSHTLREMMAMSNKASRAQRFQRKKYKYILVAPALICLIIFAYIPLGGLYIAFADYKLGRSIFSAEFVGLKNFLKFFNDVGGTSMRVLWNTFRFNIFNTVLGMVFPCAFALFLNEIESTKFKKFIQTVTFFPFFLSGIVVYSIAYNFFSSNSGALNRIMLNLGWIERSLNFMSDPQLSWKLVIGLNLWKGFGYSSVIYLAAITGIEQDQYEAARIDGAGRFGCMRHVTLPNLASTLVVLMILNAGNLVGGGDFAMMYVFTNQLNRDTMEVFSTYVYRMGLQKLRFSYATASSLMLSIVGLTVTLGTNALARRINGRSIF